MAKILVVDDSDLQRTQLKNTLQNAGHECLEAADGKIGFDLLMANPDTQLIICDVNMPVMDGITMCTKIHETAKFPTLPIFMLTTEASAELKQTAKAVGVRAWIVKPYVDEKLLSAVNKVTQK